MKFIHEGDVLTLGALSVYVLETPGHTAGGLSFKAGDVLFTGDTLFAGSCGRTDFENSDLDAMFHSLKKLADQQGDYTVCPGHGELSMLSHERTHNPYVRHAMHL